MASRVQRAAASIAELLLSGQETLALARALTLADELGVPRRPVTSVEGLPLFAWVAPETGPVLPDPYAYPAAIVACPQCPATAHVRGGVLLGTCIERQDAKPPGHNKKRDGTRTERKGGVHPFCASGKCAQGRANRQRTPKDWTHPKYRQNRPDAEKRVARAAMRLERLTTLPSRRELADRPPARVRDAMRQDPTTAEIVDECDSQQVEG